MSVKYTNGTRTNTVHTTSLARGADILSTLILLNYTIIRVDLV